MRIALSTGGGDAPGLNAAIRAAVLAAVGRGWEVLGVKRGYFGLLGEDEVVTLNADSVRGIAHMGGTILGATTRGSPFRWPVRQADGTVVEVDRSAELLANARQLGIDAVITMGGDGSLHLAHRLYEKGLHVVGVPKTIDNDVGGTVRTFGFDTAVNTVIDAIDKLHTTAESHDRVIVVEVMGRHAGFIAAYAGLAGTADVILIPEIPFDVERVCEKVRARDGAGRRFSIVVVAEGAFPRGGTPHFLQQPGTGDDSRLGGIGDVVARAIAAGTGKETRSLVLGHLQRGGPPTGYDRLLATRFGGAAVVAVADAQWGHMVALQGAGIVTVPITEALRHPKRVEPNDDVIRTARAAGISFGD